MKRTINYTYKSKNIHLVAICMSLLTPLTLSAGVDDVILYNAGKMYIGNKEKTALHIPSAVRMTGSDLNIVLEGNTVIMGNFYQDSEGNVFDAASDGTIIFRNDEDQTITCSSNLMNAFDRGKNYVAFPNIQLDKNTRLIVPPKMGIDALNVQRFAGRTGTLYLQSGPESNAAGAGIHDASLRITGSAQPDAGSVVVERYVEGYRGATLPQCGLFPFATSFKNTQRAGYFAGNWLRTTLPGANQHVEYPLANTPAPNGKIRYEHYIKPVETVLESGIAYYSRLRPSDDYDDLEFVVTGDDGSHVIPTLVFDGTVFSLPRVNELLFNDDTLFHVSLSNYQPAQTINWVIGNSYSSPLSIQKIVAKMEASTLTFSPFIYIFYGGQTSFIPIKVYDDQTPVIIENDEIPSMAVFMIRASRNATQNGGITIGRTEQVHGEITHNLKNEAVPLPDVLFRVSLAANPTISDLSVIGIREEGTLAFGSLDMEKSYNIARENFQLYTESTNGVKLSANAIPPGKHSIPLFVDIKQGPVNFLLEASRLERMDGYDVVLEDLKTKQRIDLKQQNTYEFEVAEAGDSLRFMVHFGIGGTTGIEGIPGGVELYCATGQLVVSGLTKEYYGSTIDIVDIRGMIVKSLAIDNYPVWSCPVNLQEGIYITRIKSKKPFISKFKL